MLAIDNYQATPGTALRTFLNSKTYASLIAAYNNAFAKSGHLHELWFTEYGFSTPPLAAAPNGGGFIAFSLEEQAIYTQRRLLESLGLGLDHSFFYEFINDGPAPDNVEHNFGLLSRDLKPKPAYLAFQLITHISAHWTLRPDIHPEILTHISPTPTSDKSQITRQFAFDEPGRGTVFVAWPAAKLSEIPPMRTNIRINAPCSASSVRVSSTYTHSSVLVPAHNSAGSCLLSNVPFGHEPILVYLDGKGVLNWH